MSPIDRKFSHPTGIINIGATKLFSLILDLMRSSIIADEDDDECDDEEDEYNENYLEN